MDQAALYDEDIYAWSQHQAQVLRALAGAGARLPNDLDLEHVAEEIEDLGNEQRFQVESNLGQALAHLIRIVALPGNPAVPHWTVEADAVLDTASRRYRASMRRVIEPAKLWAWALRNAGRYFEAQGHAMPVLPQDLPFAFDDLISEDASARVLAGQLTARLGQPPEA